MGAHTGYGYVVSMGGSAKINRFVPRATAMLAVSIFQKSSCDKFLGERFCVSVGTIGGAAQPVIGVITFRSNGVLVAHFVLIVVCDLV
jgi:hypothetical protein